MNALPQIYQDAVKTIKQAILESQYRSAKMISGEQLSLYFGIGCYVSEHSRTDKWGTGAIESISEQLKKELPGLHGFSAESIKKMRQFYEFWSQFINRSPSATDLQVTDSKDVASYIQVNSFALQNWSPVATEINRDDFLGISFSHHMEILNKTKDINTVLFYIHFHSNLPRRRDSSSSSSAKKANRPSLTSMLMASFLILTLCNLNRLQSALQGRFQFV